MVTKASQATVTKSLMVTDTEIRIPMDIKTTDMANNLTDLDMDKTPMDPDMDKTLMVPVMDKNPMDQDMDKTLMVPDMDKTPMDPDMDKTPMDPDMDTNHLMVMVTDTVTNPTVTDIGKISLFISGNLGIFLILKLYVKSFLLFNQHGKLGKFR